MTFSHPSTTALGLDAQTSSALSRADHHARAYLSALDSAPVATTAARAALLTQLDVPLEVEGLSADRVVDELAAAVEGGLIGSAGGRFFAWVIGGALPSAVATEWLMAAWDQNAAIYATAPAASVVEEVAGKWLLDLLRLPPHASFGFTTGCQTAHFTALAAARGPAAVALNAGDLNLGVFDPFTDLVPLAQRHGAWLHVDGAFGLFARTSGRFDALTAGIDLADSWATDCHKWLNVLQDCGFVAVRHPDAHRRGLTIRDSYFVAEDAARDEIDWNPEWSRRARGFPVYAALRDLGRAGVTSLIERSVIARINQSGEAMFGGVTWRGRRAMRVSVVNWRTTVADAERTVAAVARALSA